MLARYPEPTRTQAFVSLELGEFAPRLAVKDRVAGDEARGAVARSPSLGRSRRGRPPARVGCEPEVVVGAQQNDLTAAEWHAPGVAAFDQPPLPVEPRSPPLFQREAAGRLLDLS
jgi:hypothetical protein